MLFVLSLLFSICLANTQFFVTKDWSWSGGDMTAVNKDNSHLYKINTKLFAIGHKFKLTDANNTVLVKAAQKYTWNPKSWFVRQYKLSYLDKNKWKSVKLERKLFQFRAYKTYKLNVDGEKFETKGDVFKWKFKIVNKRGVEVAKVDLVGQDVFKFNIPNVDTYEVKVDEQLINPALVASVLAILEKNYNAPIFGRKKRK